MNFTIGCTLRYDVETLTPFVFNLEAARFPRQQILRETLTTNRPLASPTGSRQRRAATVICGSWFRRGRSRSNIWRRSASIR